mmetsp:Transcript_4556/g.9430  ORF Transcript_4556/g.9430 Transcript_4556/m.9430 type:complete len:203 (+) Transcript_4556:833-1441(+)
MPMLPWRLSAFWGVFSKNNKKNQCKISIHVRTPMPLILAISRAWSSIFGSFGLTSEGRSYFNLTPLRTLGTLEVKTWNLTCRVQNGHRLCRQTRKHGLSLIYHICCTYNLRALAAFVCVVLQKCYQHHLKFRRHCTDLQRNDPLILFLVLLVILFPMLQPNVHAENFQILLQSHPKLPVQTLFYGGPELETQRGECRSEMAT